MQHVARRRRRARPAPSRRPGTGRRVVSVTRRSSPTPPRADREAGDRADRQLDDERQQPCPPGRSPRCVIHAMKPMTSRTATGSLSPASPSSVRATRRRSVEPRRIAKIAAPSVAARIEPSSRPSSRLRSSSQDAPPGRRRSRSAIVPTSASASAGRSTGRISGKPAASPPSKRISGQRDDADRRAPARSRRSGSGRGRRSPAAMPRPMTSTRPGTRRRSPTWETAMPPASSVPAMSRSEPSSIR